MYCKDVLPSDWRYREDLIWLKYKYLKIAHAWKVRMEEQQRFDRKQRQMVIERKAKALEEENKANAAAELAKQKEEAKEAGGEQKS